MRNFGILVALMLAFAPALEAQTTIGAPGGSEVRTWGVGNTAIYGQTITAPTDLLESFSFWLGRSSPLSSTPTPSIDFYAYVYEWNSSLKRATGSALYQSALTTHATTTTSPYLRYDFSVGSLALVSGQKHVLFIQTAGGAGGIFVESTVGNEYTEGDFFFSNSSTPTGSTWAGPGWSTATDLRFEAVFAVPEPGTWLLVAGGLFGMAFMARKRLQEDIESGQA